MPGRLQDKRCLIVGGTTGLGLAAARRFLEEGATVVIAGRSEAKGSTAVETLRPIGEISFMSCEAQDTAQVEALFARSRERLGGLDILYHVAGISGRRHGDGP